MEPRRGALLTDLAAIPVGQRNMVRLAFLDRTTRSLHGDWPGVARECVAHLRMVAGRAPEDPALAALVGELTVKCAVFAELWARHDVRSKVVGPAPHRPEGAWPSASDDAVPPDDVTTRT